MFRDRRQFLQQATAIAAGLGNCAIPAAAQRRSSSMPTARARALMDAFGLRCPIFCAGMGRASNPDLAVAVSAAGGLGALGTGSRPPSSDVLRQRISQVKSRTDRPFAINYLLAFDPVTLPDALDAGAPIIQFAWGIPSPEMVAAIRKAGAKMGVQVGSAAGARRALDIGSDYLICQGTEAGGHVQATEALYDVLPAVVAEAKSIPVLAAGGIASGAHIRRALLSGAAGVLMGTRFVATKEAAAHDEYKRAITQAKSSDTVLTVCFHDGWENAPHRALRNRTFKMWEAAGCPPTGKRPGEGDVVATNATTRTTKLRYAGSSPLPDDRGSMEDWALFAGQGVDAIRDIPSAGDLVTRLWKDCLESA